MKRRYKIGLVGLTRTILLLLLFLSHDISAATIDSLTYTESNIDATNFQVISHTSYYDGTVLLRLSSTLTPTTSTPSTTSNCNEQKLFLRLIHLDGSINELNIDVPQIPSENFCLNTTNLLEQKDHIKISALSSQFIIVTYYCDLSSNLNLCGSIIDWNGKILNGNENLGASCDDDEIVQSVDSGFLWLCYIQGSVQLNWYKFNAPDSSGSINLLTKGTITNVTSFNSNSTRIFATEDGGYGIVTVGNNPSTTQSSTTQQSLSVQVTFISQTKDIINGPFQIYYLDNVQQLDLYSCNIAYDSYGYSCIINVLRVNGQTNFVNINFSSSGSVLSNMAEFTINNNLIIGSKIFDIIPLYYGGLMILTENIFYQKIINGLIYDNQSNYFGNWDIPTNQYNITKHIGLLPNNTIWVISKNDGENFWNFITSSSLTNFGMVQKYGNALISSTIPTINSIIPLMSTTNLQIQFTINTIQLSSKGNLSIIDDKNNIIRQSFNNYNGDSIFMINDHTIEIRNIYQSTFNRKNTLYYILIDNGFVKDSKIDQELLGIRKGLWKFSTDSNSEEQPYLKESIIGSTNAILRLSTNGTSYFASLSNDEKIQFTKNLASNLSLIIPCDSNRISIDDRYQFDTDLSQRQTLLLVRITRERKSDLDVDNNVSSPQIVKDLDLLVQNRDYNAMSTSGVTSLLDASYGARPIPSLWSRYKYILIGVAFGFLFLTLFYYYARNYARKKKIQANNKVIFMYTFVIVDFVLDIVFVSIHGNDLPWLYPTSVIFVSLPVLLNLIFTYIIIIRETRANKTFTDWWIKNPKNALLFTLLSGIDIQALKLVSSRCFGCIKFCAPLIRTEHCVFVANTIGIFIEDVPQFIILVLYQRYTILPNIIPMLALSSCSLVLLAKLFCLIKHDTIPSEPCGHGGEKLSEISVRGININNNDNNKQYEKENEYFTEISEDKDTTKKIQIKNFFGQDSSKRDSNNSNNLSYFSEALKLFSSNGSDNESPQSERITAFHEGNYFGKNEKTGEPIFLLRDPEDYNVEKIKQLSHGKLVGDSIVTTSKFGPGKITDIHDKRLSDVAIICNTMSNNNDKDEKEISPDDDDNSENKRDTQYSGSTTDRTRSTYSFQTSITTTSGADDNENTLRKQLSSVSLNQQNNFGIISEKQDNDRGDDGDDGDKEEKEKETIE